MRRPLDYVFYKHHSSMLRLGKQRSAADVDFDEMQIPQTEAPPSPVKALVDAAAPSAPRRIGARSGVALTVLAAAHKGGNAGQLMEALDRTPTSATAVEPGSALTPLMLACRD